MKNVKNQNRKIRESMIHHAKAVILEHLRIGRDLENRQVEGDHLLLVCVVTNFVVSDQPRVPITVQQPLT